MDGRYTDSSVQLSHCNVNEALHLEVSWHVGRVD